MKNRMRQDTLPYGESWRSSLLNQSDAFQNFHKFFPSSRPLQTLLYLTAVKLFHRQCLSSPPRSLLILSALISEL